MKKTSQEQSNGVSATQQAGFGGVSTDHDEERLFIPKDNSWSAKWIWLNRSAFLERQTCRATTFCTNETPFTVALIRKSFDIPFVPCRATAWISGDTKYRGWINSTLVARGPAEVGGDYGNCEAPDWWFYEGIDVSSWVRQGRNIIAADVMLGPQVQADYSMGRGGFLLELAIEGEGGERFTVCTDENWRATLSPAETLQDTYDARNEFHGWKDADFDDSAWPGANIVGTVEQSSWNLLPREIPMLAETCIPPVAVEFEDRPASVNAFPFTMKRGEPRMFRLQFPREVSGHVFLDMNGNEGTRIDLDFRELPDVPGRQETVFLPGHRWSYQSRRLHGFEYLQVTVTFPERTPRSEALTVHAIAAVLTSFPVKYRGQFTCSDPFLNQLWDVGRWTDQICMQAYHLDSPIHQEGLGCTADYMIEALISYCCFGEARLARKDILRTSYLLRQKQGRMFMPSYSLLWVWMLHDYWMYSGDADTVREVAATMHDLLDLFDTYVGPTGLVTGVPNYIFMDWVELNGYKLHHPPGSIGQGYMTAFYYKSLIYGAELSRLGNEGDQADLYNQRASAVKSAFNNQLWRPEHGMYCDGIPGATTSKPDRWLPADPTDESFTVHTNAAAIAVGLVPADSMQSIMRRIMADDTLTMVQPYFMHYVFDALEKAGLFEEYAFDLMARWKRIVGEHPTSLKEMWDGGDYSHAWGGTPTYQLSTRVLGISCLGPGFRSFAVSPRLGPLHAAQGIIPTPQGPIRVAWRKNGDSLSGCLSGSCGTEASLRAKRATVLQNGERIDGVTSGRDGLCWTLNGGEYVIVIATEQQAEGDAVTRAP